MNGELEMHQGKIELNLTVNGIERCLMVEPDMMLLSVIRDVLRLTGTKHGCDDANCGVCSVLLNGKVVKSCCLLALQAEGAEITTIEGLSRIENGREILHPLQEAFIETGAIQCGFCTPGMILTAKALLDENNNPGEEDIREALHGNLCRCTGYLKIVEAIELVRDRMFSSVK
jgi:aerobic-type carbon monoxide dehydrogenase small subunit (CoxS/CutS family)